MFHKHYFKNFSAEKLGLPQGPLREDRGTLQEGEQSSSTANICLGVKGYLQNKAASYITVGGGGGGGGNSVRTCSGGQKDE